MSIFVSLSIILLSLLFFVLLINLEMVFAFIVFVIVVVLGVWSQFQEADAKLKNKDSKTKLFDSIRSSYNLPDSAKKMKILRYNNSFCPKDSEAFVWMDNDVMIILDIFTYESVKKIMSGIKLNNCNLSNLDLIEIELNDIDYFFEAGEFSTYANVSGGGGGGSSLLGAAAGGVIFGGVGAIIGSRKKIDPITTELLVQDTRETILKYYINEDEYFIHFSANELKKFNELIPSKKLSVVNKDESNTSISEPIIDVTSRLEKLIELNNKGLINNHEYEEKRKEILDNI